MSGAEELDGLAILHRRVIVNRDFDVRSRAGFAGDHAALLRDIDGAATVLELISTWGRAGAERALAALLDLHRWGACQFLEERPAGDSVVPVPAAEPDEVEPELDERLLAEAVELDEATKQRILGAARMLREGRILELLGVTSATDRVELKRAYFALAKEFHPDRFYGRKLGSFAPLLATVFAAASQAVKTIIDQRTVLRDAADTSTQRRRSPRYAFLAPVRLRCESWPETARVMMRQVSSGGLFVDTDQPAAVGERVVMELTLPGRGLLPLQGRIVARVAARGGRPAGLCVQFSPLSESERVRFTTLLDAARTATPAPVTDPAAPEATRRPRLARGSGRVRSIAPIVGIDLGTTFVSVTAAIDGRVHVLPCPDGQRAIPSVVAFPQRGEVVVGARARERLLRDPRHAVASVKRLLGRQADDVEIQGQVASAGYSTLAGPGGELLVEMWGEPYAIPQICGYLFEAARAVAERALGRPVGSAVVTAPLSFGPERVGLLKRAARMAHLEVIDVVHEPNAAALANRFRPDFGGVIGVYDFGGGTFDFSLIDATGGDFRVIATAGDSWLGGDDFDIAVAEALANQCWRRHGVDLRQRAVEWQRLLYAAEQAKRALSTTDETTIVVPDVVHTARGASDLRGRIQRQQAEKIWRPLIDRSMHTCLQTLTFAGLRPSDLSAVYLSGGTTHIPLVQKQIQRYFGTAPRTGVSPEFAVCLGAGVHAAQLEQLQEPTLPTMAS